jgi:hypothetical protein
VSDVVELPGVHDSVLQRPNIILDVLLDVKYYAII